MFLVKIPYLLAEKKDKIFDLEKANIIDIEKDYISIILNIGMVNLTTNPESKNAVTDKVFNDVKVVIDKHLSFITGIEY